jgi:hypothetical protein
MKVCNEDSLVLWEAWQVTLRAIFATLVILEVRQRFRAMLLERKILSRVSQSSLICLRMIFD